MMRFAANGQSEVVRPLSAGRRLVLVFQLAGQSYALPISAVSEIVPLAQLSQPPALPPVLAGFLNLGGVATPVVRLARLLGVTEQPVELYTPLIILRNTGSPLALLVDRVLGIDSLGACDVAPIGEAYCFNDCAEGLLTLNGSRVVLLSEHRLLRRQEEQRLAELAAIEQTRLAELHGAQP